MQGTKTSSEEDLLYPTSRVQSSKKIDTWVIIGNSNDQSKYGVLQKHTTEGI